MPNALEQARSKMNGLIDGSLSREEVADWAMARIRDDSADYSSNATLWAALDRLAGADLQRGPGEYLHGEEDFRAWLTDLSD